MTTIAWFHCFAGIAGDMALGACLDAGADLDEVLTMLRQLPVGGWSIEDEQTMRGGIAATRAVVRAEEQQVVRTHAHISGLLAEARLPERVRSRSLRVFQMLAEVEGKLHRRSPDQVHFHEVGSLDAIVDIVGTCSALEVLGVDDVRASAVATGTGMVRSSHGMLPNPAPAVVQLLEGAPIYGIDVTTELTTPTGAALLAGLSSGFGPIPAMRVERSGFGAGTHELDAMPNLTQVVIGEAMDRHEAPAAGQPISLIETNLDDVSGEVIAHTVDALMAAGALDAWTAVITMKKGRPAVQVSVLCDVADTSRLRDLLAHETGTLGIRVHQMERWPFPRSVNQVEVDGYPIRVKRSAWHVKVEYEDAAFVAKHSGRSVREVVSIAEAVARKEYEDAAGAETETEAEADEHHHGDLEPPTPLPTRPRPTRPAG